MPDPDGRTRVLLVYIELAQQRTEEALEGVAAAAAARHTPEYIRMLAAQTGGGVAAWTFLEAALRSPEWARALQAEVYASGDDPEEWATAADDLIRALPVSSVVPPPGEEGADPA